MSARKSELTDRPNKRRAGSGAGGLTVAESRPQVVDGKLIGARCTRCGHVIAQHDVPWCPDCYGAVERAAFEPVGTVWAATTARIPVGRWKPPFGLAYVDVVDGPRVLVHVPADEDIPLRGSTIEFVTEGGDLVERELAMGGAQ
ncbi:Zn-ribbon domain-containing OB-fold protein [Gordonia sp. NPDC058843]|uniref:Zn-ribbon domain-containing OB-fold protein n=1 Tax=Gordonia sp. NPDC058843 TaxID=3346648 RepID=UPI00368FBF98